MSEVDNSNKLLFVDMKPNVVYYPSNEKYPAVDFMFVTGNPRKLVGIQAFFRKERYRELEARPLKKFLSGIGADISDFELVCIASPKHNADDLGVTLPVSILKKYTRWFHPAF
jgi:hypothetical protein